MQVVYAREPYFRTIFLAGPTPRNGETESWRPEALRHLKELGFDGSVIVPEDRQGQMPKEEREAQRIWERLALDHATLILFWIPRELGKMPAFTTNIEWGRSIERYPRKLILGHPLPKPPKMNYILDDAHENSVPVVHSLRELCSMAVECFRRHQHGPV